WQKWTGGCLSHLVPSMWGDCLPYYTLSEHWAQAKAKLLAYQKTAADWQGRVTGACPDYKPPPPPPAPKPPPHTGGGDVGDWLDTLKSIALIAAGTVAIVYIGGPIMSRVAAKG
ncbi:MAG TPA: hypothetical protein VJY33_03460, partial [Isosphaeraceae bacterium]|nr:hypothetical protein [Isosphaeraceae bacterium]